MADSPIVQYVQKFKWADQKPETQHLTKRAIIDELGCSLAGSAHKTVPGVIETLQGIDGQGTFAVWGTDKTLDIKGAIFLNAYTGALFDMDDGHRRAQGHPGAVLVPVALTLGAKLKCSGVKLLEAVAVGYDVAIREAVRIREAGGPRKGSSGWCAPGAAATAGKLLDLTDEQMANAIGLAEYFTPQAGQDRSVQFPSMMKEGIPWGSYTGTFCAMLAKGGFTAHRPHLADAEELCKDLGERIEVEFAYYKKWAACRWAHPALSGLEKCKAETAGFDISKVKHVNLRTFEKGLLLNNRKPGNTLQAVYSIPFSIAFWLKNGKIEPDDVKEDEKMVSDAEVLDMATRIDMEHAQEYTDQFPLRCIQDVIVTWQDGTTWKMNELESPGDPGERAFTDEEIKRKFKTLSEPIVGAKWEEILNLVEKLELVTDVSFVTDKMAM